MLQLPAVFTVRAVLNYAMLNIWEDKANI
jgi:hypothetical protein